MKGDIFIIKVNFFFFKWKIDFFGVFCILFVINVVYCKLMVIIFIGYIELYFKGEKLIMFLFVVLCYNWIDDKVGSGISIVYIILEKGFSIT